MKKFFSALFVLGIVVLAASPASSHSVFVGSNPEPDSVIKQMPAEFRLQFNEDLLVIGEDDPNQLKVRDKNGAIVSAASEVAGPFIFAKALSQEFVSGKYDVDYRIVSGDGHVVEGSYSFDYQIEVESAATTAAVKQSPAPKEIDGSKSEHSEHGSFIHVHSDHIAMAVIALIAIGSWFLYRKINDY
ncbi:MAG: copper resistance protein CopC [Actinobacteria bacterium]|nr:copper resistance protein CopC [Actinomycetota bacterium]